MAKVIFYKQVREDGGVRTGIEIDDLTYFERYEPCGEDDDPTLVWFADVRGEGKGLPSQPNKARDWLLANAGLIEKNLAKLADEIRVGIDVDSYPMKRKVPDSPKGLHITIVCSASRRMAARNMAQELTSLAKDWKHII